MVSTDNAAAASRTTIGRPLAIVLGLLTIFGPISTNLYLPVLPALTADFQSSTSEGQLTVTACLLGLAVGQVIAGSLSDRFGRRRPLLVGVLTYVAMSVVCAVSPTIETLIAARFVQGLAAAVGIVTAQAAGRDVYSGGKLVRYYGRLTVLGGMSAVLGPLIGGQLARFTDWHGVFLFLATAGALVMLTALVFFPETLPTGCRSTGGFSQGMRNYRQLLTDRTFVGAVLITGLTYSAIYAYLGAATFVLQGMYGLSPQEYSFAFALNAVGVMVFGHVGGRLSERWSEKKTLGIGLGMAMSGSLGLLATALSSPPLIGILVSLFVMVGGVAMASPPATSLALRDHPEIAGTASSMVGLSRFALGGLTAPLVGIGGPDTAVPFGIVAVASVSAAIACLGLLGSRQRLRS
ncbi:multidrug effflux MFS transporter [Arthrobacter sp. NPDC057009]|uniref:multidrug effflux MFS transporter n=1 Tax=Arthrobacter sp. NPDC057009 TaxID=3345996 RepID=UPI00362534C3